MPENSLLLSNLPELVRASVLCKSLGISRSTLHKWTREGNFPPPVRFGPRFTAWRRIDVELWLNEASAHGDLE